MSRAAIYDQLRTTIARRYSMHGDLRDREAIKRRRSNALAAELRRRGMLAEEGYAPGSWAAGGRP